jgi:hypothetical protein
MMRRIYEKWLQLFGVIGYIRLFRDCGHTLVPGKWTPRFDDKGRIYMLISPHEDV